jgi:hypothetical protein
MNPLSTTSVQPVGGNYYGYPGYDYGYQQPNPISQTTDQFTRGLQDSVNDAQRSFRRMQRTWNGEPEYSVARLASWGGGAALLWSVIDSNLRSRPEGLMALAVLGVGAWAGNWAYDWFMDRFGQNFGY